MKCWKRLNVNSDVYIIRFSLEKNENEFTSLTCWLSDFKSIWKESFESSVVLMRRVQDENILLIASEIEDKIFETIASAPEENIDNFISITKKDGDQCMQLRLKYYLSAKVPLKFYWNLKKCEQDDFFEEVTLPMLQQLDEPVKAKDREIEQYKLEGAATLTRKQLITEPFDAKEFLPNSVQCFECSAVFSDLLQNLVPQKGNAAEWASAAARANEDSIQSSSIGFPVKRFRKRKKYFEGKKAISFRYNNEDDDCNEKVIREPNDISSSPGKSLGQEGSNDNKIEDPTEKSPLDVDKSNEMNKKKFRKILNL